MENIVFLLVEAAAACARSDRCARRHDGGAAGTTEEVAARLERVDSGLERAPKLYIFI